MVDENSDIIMASLAKSPKKNIEDFKAVLLVSINSENKGDNFAATSDMLKSLNFKQVVILVACELQMDTLYGLGLTENIEDARKLAKKMGDQWVEEHKKYLQNFTVLRWGEFVSSEKYKTLKNETDKLFITNSKIKDSLPKTGKEFVLRYKKAKFTEIDEDKLLKQSLNYLKNESPIIPYFLSSGFDAILYNNSPNYTFQTLLEYYNNNSEKKLTWLRFDFSLRKVASLKLNALQSGKHGFSCSRDELEKFIKSRVSNVLFFKNVNDVLNSNDNVELLLKNVRQQIDMLAEAINKLPTDLKHSAYEMISKKISSADFAKNDLKVK